MLRIDPLEPMLRIEPAEPLRRRERRSLRMGPFSQPGREPVGAGRPPQPTCCSHPVVA
jgi:hypothetical protein